MREEEEEEQTREREKKKWVKGDGDTGSRRSTSKGRARKRDGEQVFLFIQISIILPVSRRAVWWRPPGGGRGHRNSTTASEPSGILFDLENSEAARRATPLPHARRGFAFFYPAVQASQPRALSLII